LIRQEKFHASLEWVRTQAGLAVRVPAWRGAAVRARIFDPAGGSVPQAVVDPSAQEGLLALPALFPGRYLLELRSGESRVSGTFIIAR
jgi:hypothetical protein